ncbi:MAG: SCO6880 family protein [Actinomycetota bacterium]
MSARTYRLPPRDRTGWFLGLEGPRVLVLGTGLLATSVLALNASHPGVALAPAIIGVSLAFARLGGEPLVEAIPPLVAFAARRVVGRRSWLAPDPGRVVPEGPALPPAMAGQSLVSCVVDGRRDRGPLGVVHDRRTGAWAATLRVAGNGFCLLDAADQERLLSLWGQALSGFCRDDSPVTALRWALRSSPVPIPEPVLVEAAPPTRRDVLVTLVTDGTRRPGSAPADVLSGEVSRLAERLDAAGLVVSGPLAAGELAAALRVRLDPTVEAQLLTRAATLGERAGVVSPGNAGPLATHEELGAVRIDGSWHRVFVVTEWPRAEVPPGWLAGLLPVEGVTWTLSVWCEPVPPRASRRAIERQAAKLTSDEEQRLRAGFRVGAEHGRLHQALSEREQELASGHGEIDYVGLVAVTAADASTLDRDCATVVQAAAACGIDLRVLRGRQMAALGACLPLARGLAGRRP